MDDFELNKFVPDIRAGEYFDLDLGFTATDTCCKKYISS